MGVSEAAQAVRQLSVAL